MDPKKNISDMMPSYVNGTLDDASRRQIENVLKNSPSAQAEVSWLKRLREQIKGDKDIVQLPPEDAGLDRLMTLIAAEKSGKVTTIAPLSASSSKWVKPALAIAASVMFAQAIGLFVLFNNGPTADTIRTLAGGATASQGATLQVTFKPATTESQMRASLALIDGEIIGGPGVLGVYTIRTKKGTGSNSANKLLQQKSVIDTVTVLQD
jgi:hypothetical protein